MATKKLIGSTLVAGSSQTLTIDLDAGQTFETGSIVTFIAARDFDHTTQLDISKAVAPPDLTSTRAIVRLSASDTAIDLGTRTEVKMYFQIKVVTQSNYVDYLELENGLQRGHFTLVKALA